MDKFHRSILWDHHLITDLTKPCPSCKQSAIKTWRLRTQSEYIILLSPDGHFWLLVHIRPSARHGLKFISGRHMRSKRRCSCVLQFTRLHAVSCVLHRPTSRVIHHTRLIFFYQQFFILFVCSVFIWFFWLSSTPSGGQCHIHLQNNGSQASPKLECVIWWDGWGKKQ